MPAAPDLARYVPNCRVEVDGQALDVGIRALLTRVEVDLDADLIGQCKLSFADPQLKLMNSDQFGSGAQIRIAMGYGSSLGQIFEGEVVSLQPRFIRDKPPALQVVCSEVLHRLALSQGNRALNNVDTKQVVQQIASSHGLTSDAPAGTGEHMMQGTVTDLSVLKRVARRSGSTLRMEGKKIVLGAAARTGDDLTLRFGDGVAKVKMHVKSGGQVGAVSVHGWDARNKREVSGRAEPQGDSGQGARDFGAGDELAITHEEMTPADNSTAEATARGRMQRLQEKFVQAKIETTGNPELIPGREFSLEKIGETIDGKFRVEHATHSFDKHGYHLALQAVRTKKKDPPRPPPVQPGELSNPRWDEQSYEHGAVAVMKVDGRNLESRSVRFVVEHRTCANRWEPWGVATASVDGGVASARIPVVHPAARHYDARPDEVPCARAVHGQRDLRFTAALASGFASSVSTASGASGAAEPDDSALINPRWGKEAHQHGESAEMIVEAHGWNGRLVWFSLEHDRGGGNWEPIGDPVHATVRHCKAKAEVSLSHPLQDHFDERGATPHPQPDATSGPRQLRFKTSFTRPTPPPRPPPTAFFLSRRLLAHGGTPLVDQPVRIIDPATGARVGRPARTDSAGNLFVRVPENKPYDISIVDPHQHDHALEGPSTRGPLDYPMLTVHLVDAAGAPLANVQWRATGPHGATLSGTTNAQGDINCGPADLGVYELTVRGHSYKVHTVRESRIDPAIPNRLVIR